MGSRIQMLKHFMGTRGFGCSPGIWAASSLLALVGACTPSISERIEEASGLVRSGDSLLIVDDGRPGVYFRLRIDGAKGPTMPITPDRIQRILLPGADFIPDLEAIEVLGDGRIVVLSEQLHSLYSENGMVARYDEELAEVGGRGLEGIAVKALPGGDSRIAVVWEGGYLQPESLNPQLRSSIGRKYLQPLLLIHDLARSQNGGLVHVESARLFTTLQLPIPDGMEPEAQRFRAPDLVWHTLTDAGGNEEGFIVLISSSSGTDIPKYQYHWLQRFSLNGRPVGRPLDIDAVAPPELVGVNWEGLAWFEEEKSLVLVHERGNAPATYAFVLPIPDEWKEP
jgi:hypothetical protein